MIQDAYGMSDTFFGECSTFLWSLQDKTTAPVRTDSMTKESRTDSAKGQKPIEQPLSGSYTDAILEYTERTQSLEIRDETDFQDCPMITRRGTLIVDYNDDPSVSDEGTLLT